MKAKLFLRAVCLLLALLMAGACVSCAPTVTEPTANGQRLEIERDAVVYSAELVSQSATRIAELLARALSLAGGPQMSEADKESVRERAAREFLPACMRAGLYPEELSGVLTLTEEYCTAQESAGLSSRERLASFCDFYGHAVATVGSERAGELLFEATSLYLNAQITFFEQRYLEYGYAWYWQDAERYREKAQTLRESLGAENFSHAVQVFLFIGSLIAGIAPTEWEASGPKLYDAELLLILRRQAGHFDSLALTGAQWAFLAELFEDAVPDTRDSVWSAELSVLFSQGRVGKMARTMPQLLTLYHAFATALTEQELAALRAGDAQAVICGVLTRCKQPLRGFLDDFSTAAAGATQQELAALTALGQGAAIEAFLAEYPLLSTDELMQTIEDIATGRESAPEGMSAALCGWLCGVAPYLTFAIWSL